MEKNRQLEQDRQENFKSYPQLLIVDGWALVQ